VLCVLWFKFSDVHNIFFVDIFLDFLDTKHLECSSLIFLIILNILQTCSHNFHPTKENKMWFFTADEHYYHTNIVKYCNRPFSSIEKMNEELIKRHNEKVSKNDIVVHAGDFSLANKTKTKEIIKQLNGTHIFLKGDHDRWLSPRTTQIWQKRIDKHYIVVCHYCLRVWPKSHYGSWHLFAHSHGRLEPIGKSWDIGVDNNDYYPISMDELVEIMEKRPDNPNLVKERV